MNEVLGKLNDFARAVSPKFTRMRVHARFRWSGCPLVRGNVVVPDGDIAVFFTTIAGPALV